MPNSINCPICENLCSTQAVACPKCGHPISKIDQNAVEDTNANQNPPTQTTGSTLRGILWVFFVLSLFYATGAVRIWTSMPLPVYGYNDSQLLEDKIAIAFHLAPLIIMVIVLAIVYSAKERS